MSVYDDLRNNKKKKPEKKPEKKLKEEERKKEEKKREEKVSPIQTIKQMSVKQRRKWIIISIVIGYACFLLFGLVSSDFVVDERGIAVPVAKSQSEVKTIEEYKLLKSFYDDAQAKYKEVLDTDIEIANDSSKAKLIATRYEKILSWYDAYLTQLKAVEVSTDYAFIKENLVSWAANDICVYLQNISSAFSTGNQEKLSVALDDRYRTMNDFNVITSDLLTIGETIEGANLTGLDFNPEKHGLGGDANGVR